ASARHRVRELRGHPAVAHDGVPADVGREVGREEQQHRRDVRGNGDTADRGVVDVALLAASSMYWEMRGVHTMPGATALTRMFDGPSSTAAVRTSDISPALATPYAACIGAELMPDTDATNTMTP